MPQKSQKTGFRGPSPDVGKATQFKSGAEWTGNPGGRPKSKLLSEAYQKKLAEIEASGDRSRAERIAETMIRAAEQGSVSAALEVANRTEGKPMQRIEMAQYSEETVQTIAQIWREMYPLDTAELPKFAWPEIRPFKPAVAETPHYEGKLVNDVMPEPRADRAPNPHPGTGSGGVPMAAVGGFSSFPIDLTSGERIK